MKLCAIYARVSSNLQDIENSISAQIRICSEYAQKKGYSISGIYSDEAESGASTIKRAEFNKLLEDAREKKFDIILADKTDRFSRNKEDSIIAKMLIRKAGVELFFVTDNLKAGEDETFLQEGLLEIFAQWYRINLAREVRKGQRQGLVRGFHTQGDAPYGYRLKKVTDADGKGKTKLEPDPIEAPVIKKAFEMSASGKSSYQVFEFLKTSNLRVRHKNAGQVSRHTVKLILENELYTGKRKYRDEVFEVPAIISEDLFREAKEKRRNNIGVRQNNKNKFPLLKSIYCKKCGRKMTTSTVRRFRYYACSERAHYGNCTLKKINASTLEEKIKAIFLRKIKKYLNNSLEVEITNKESNFSEKIAEIEKQLKEVERQKGNIVNSIAEGISINLVKGKLESLENTEKKLREELRQVEKPEVKKEDFYREIDIITLIKNAKPEELQLIYKDLIRIEIDVENCTGFLYINYLPNSEKPIKFKFERVKKDWYSNKRNRDKREIE